jgi:hypothetical protein
VRAASSSSGAATAEAAAASSGDVSLLQLKALRRVGSQSRVQLCIVITLLAERYTGSANPRTLSNALRSFLHSVVRLFPPMLTTREATSDPGAAEAHEAKQSQPQASQRRSVSLAAELAGEELPLETVAAPGTQAESDRPAAAALAASPQQPVPQTPPPPPYIPRVLRVISELLVLFAVVFRAALSALQVAFARRHFVAQLAAALPPLTLQLQNSAIDLQGLLDRIAFKSAAPEPLSALDCSSSTAAAVAGSGAAAAAVDRSRLYASLASLHGRLSSARARTTLCGQRALQDRETVQPEQLEQRLRSDLEYIVQAVHQSAALLRDCERFLAPPQPNGDAAASERKSAGAMHSFGADATDGGDAQPSNESAQELLGALQRAISARSRERESGLIFEGDGLIQRSGPRPQKADSAAGGGGGAAASSASRSTGVVVSMRDTLMLMQELQSVPKHRQPVWQPASQPTLVADDDSETSAAAGAAAAEPGVSGSRTAAARQVQTRASARDVLEARHLFGMDTGEDDD